MREEYARNISFFHGKIKDDKWMPRNSIREILFGNKLVFFGLVLKVVHSTRDEERKGCGCGGWGLGLGVGVGGRGQVGRGSKKKLLGKSF